VLAQPTHNIPLPRAYARIFFANVVLQLSPYILSPAILIPLISTMTSPTFNELLVILFDRISALMHCTVQLFALDRFLIKIITFVSKLLFDCSIVRVLKGAAVVDTTSAEDGPSAAEDGQLPA